MTGELLKRRELCLDTARFEYSRAFDCEYPILFRPLKRWANGQVCHSVAKCVWGFTPGSDAGFGCRCHPLAVPSTVEGSREAIADRSLSSKFVADRHSRRKARSPRSDAGVHSRLQQVATPFDLSQLIAGEIANLVPSDVRFVDLGAGNGSLSAALLCEGFGGSGVEIDNRCQLLWLTEGFMRSKWNLLGSFRMDYAYDLLSVVDIHDSSILRVKLDRLNSFVIANPPFSNLEDFVKCAARLSNLVFILVPDTSSPTLSELAITLGYGIVPVNSYSFELSKTRPWHSQEFSAVSMTLFMLYNNFDNFYPNDKGLRYDIVGWSKTNERDYTEGSKKNKCVYIKQNKRNPEQGGYLNYDPSPKGKIFSAIPPGNGLHEIVKVTLNREDVWTRPIRVAPGVILPMEFAGRDSLSMPSKYVFYNELTDAQLHSLRILRVFRHSKDSSYTTYYGLVDRYGNSIPCYKVRTEKKPVIVPCAAIKVSKKYDPKIYCHDHAVWTPRDDDEHVYYFNGDILVPEELWPGAIDAAYQRVTYVATQYKDPTQVEKSLGSGTLPFADRYILSCSSSVDSSHF